MKDITIDTNPNNQEVVSWIDEQGYHSMLKSAYDEMIANQQNNQEVTNAN